MVTVARAIVTVVELFTLLKPDKEKKPVSIDNRGTGVTLNTLVCKKSILCYLQCMYDFGTTEHYRK